MLKEPRKAGDPTDPEFGMMPRLFSDDYATAKNHVLRPTVTQYTILQRWAAGEFVNGLKEPSKRDELLPTSSGESASACSGGPFYPGIEVGAVMADAATYSEAFCVDADGHEPGQVTAGNAVPWQADFLACSVDEQAQLGWWPAQRPYQVLPSVEAKASHFWHRGVSGFLGMVTSSGRSSRASPAPRPSSEVLWQPTREAWASASTTTWAPACSTTRRRPAGRTRRFGHAGGRLPS